MHMQVRRLIAITIVFMLTGAVCAAAIEEKDRMTVRGGKLWQARKACVLRAVETPALARPENGYATIAEALHRLCDVGANAVCFDLCGLSADGKTLSPDEVKAIDVLMKQVTWRRMAAICRVFGADAPKDDAYRSAAVVAAATALKDEDRVVYWIDGPNAKGLVSKFRKLAPDLVIAAEAGGDIDVVTSVPAGAPKTLTLVAGAIPGPELRDEVHFVMPAGDASLKALDTAFADPAESKPWTPDNSVLSEQERAEGFVVLFDGKSFDGWWMIGKNKQGFAVKDGTIEWQALGGGGLYTRDRYDNFVLRFEWKIKKSGNSGVYLRAPRAGRQSKVGMEFQLQGDSGSKIIDQTTGAIYSVVPPLVNAAKPEGEWNSVEITLNGPSMKAVLNGQAIQDLNLDQNEELKVRLRKGFIGLQDHGCYVAFRNIRIKRL